VLVYHRDTAAMSVPQDGESVKIARNNRQFIVPTAYREPIDGALRGITTIRLAFLLGPLT
jgi:hypothetical protein